MIRGTLNTIKKGNGTSGADFCSTRKRSKNDGNQQGNDSFGSLTGLDGLLKSFTGRKKLRAKFEENLEESIVL